MIGHRLCNSGALNLTKIIILWMFIPSMFLTFTSKVHNHLIDTLFLVSPNNEYFFLALSTTHYFPLTNFYHCLTPSWDFLPNHRLFCPLGYHPIWRSSLWLFLIFNGFRQYQYPYESHHQPIYPNISICSSVSPLPSTLSDILDFRILSRPNVPGNIVHGDCF